MKAQKPETEEERSLLAAYVAAALGHSAALREWVATPNPDKKMSKVRADVAKLDADYAQFLWMEWRRKNPGHPEQRTVAAGR